MIPEGQAAARDGTAGVTLVEVLVALALFALIGAAGFSVLDQMLRIQSGTEGRLADLAALQRAMHLTTRDFLQAEGGSLAFADGAVAFRRPGAGGEMAVSYALRDGELLRSLSGLGTAPARQVLLTGVEALAWRFYTPGRGWVETWPPEPGEAAGNPAAVSLELSLSGAALAGPLRRVAILPAEVVP